MNKILKFKPYPDQISSTYVVLTVLFVCCLLISDVVGGRLMKIGSFSVTSAIFLFPITYIFGDILTEVYGFERSRLVIWLGMLVSILMSVYFFLIIQTQTPGFFKDAEAYKTVLGITPLIVFASNIGYFAGEFANSACVSIVKKITKGRFLWIRIIGSTIVGEFLDTLLFISIAFSTILPFSALLQLLIAQYIFKTVYEIVATPLTYFVVNKIKRVEQLDTFDYGVFYNPFSLKIGSPSDK